MHTSGQHSSFSSRGVEVVARSQWAQSLCGGWNLVRLVGFGSRTRVTAADNKSDRLSVSYCIFYTRVCFICQCTSFSVGASCGFVDYTKYKALCFVPR